MLRHLSSPRRHRDPAHAARIAGAIYGGALRDHPELAEPITLALPRPVSRRGYLYQLTASAGWTSLPVLRLIRQPTLILAGDDDPIIPLANGRLMAALLPDARLHVYRTVTSACSPGPPSSPPWSAISCSPLNRARGARCNE